MASIIFKGPARYCKRRRKPAKQTGYTTRNEVLLRIGFPSYREYLESDFWKLLRGVKLAADPQCELCDKAASEVHHLNYTLSTLTGKHQHKLVSVCRGCHEDLEIRADGTKRSFEGAMKRTRDKLRKLGKWKQHTWRGAKE